MSSAARQFPATFVDEGDEESTEELLPHQKEHWCIRQSATWAGLLLGAALACTAVAVLGLPGAGQGGAAPLRAQPQPFTVRHLLEGDDLANVITDNFMTFGRGYLNPAHRGEVRAAVSDNLLNISNTIHERLPEDHARLGSIELSQEQKGAVLRLLGHYSDPRLQRLGNEMTQVTAQTWAKGGDRKELQQRLAEEVREHREELNGLCRDISPDADEEELVIGADDFEDYEPVQQFDKWNIQVEVSPPKAKNGGQTGFFAVRRLTSRDTLGGTQDQTTIALRHLEGLLGEKMPAAPARMLLFEKQKAYEQSTTGWERLQKCIMENTTDLPQMFQCLMENCHRAMSWLLKKLHLDKVVDKFTKGAR